LAKCSGKNPRLPTTIPKVIVLGFADMTLILLQFRS
jgi:hypothetical protein